MSAICLNLCLNLNLKPLYPFSFNLELLYPFSFLLSPLPSIPPSRQRWEDGPERCGRQSAAGDGEIPQAFQARGSRANSEHPTVATPDVRKDVRRDAHDKKIGLAFHEIRKDPRVSRVPLNTSHMSENHIPAGHYTESTF